MQTHNVKPVTCLMIFPLSDMSDVSDFIHVSLWQRWAKIAFVAWAHLITFPDHGKQGIKSPSVLLA